MKTTRLPTVAGILTIIAASIALILGSGFLIAAIVENLPESLYTRYLMYVTSFLFLSLYYFLSFGFGLIGGICCIKRKKFTLAILGSSLPIAMAIISIFSAHSFSISLRNPLIRIPVEYAGAPLAILGTLATISIYISKREFLSKAKNLT
jgi:hypothetical protein